MRTSLFFLLVLFLVSACLSQKLTVDEREILWHQDQRSLADSVLYRYLTNKKSSLRSRAAIAIGNIQDTSSIRHLLPFLNDKSRTVRATAAFALGQIGSSSVENDIAERLRSELSGNVIARLLEALGKCGSDRVYDDVVSFGLPRKLELLKADQALSLARFALRNIKTPRGISFCFDLLLENDARTRWCALYALWRMGPHSTIDAEIGLRKELLAKLATDKYSYVRMNLAALLGRSRTEAAAELLLALQKKENEKGRRNWRVRVNIARSLAVIAPKNGEAVSRLISYLQLGNEHVQITAITLLGGLQREVIAKHGENGVLRKLLLSLASNRSKDETVRGEAIVALGRHFPGDFKYDSMFSGKKMSPRLKAKVVEGMSYISSGEHLRILLERVEDDSVPVVLAAWEGIRRILEPKSLSLFQKDTLVTKDLGSRLFRKIKGSLLRDDMAITTTVAAGLSDSTYFRIFRRDGSDEQIIEELMLAYGKLSAPNDVEAMQAILATLGKLGDNRVIPLLTEALDDPDRTVGLAAAAGLKQLTGEDATDQVAVSTKPLYTDYDWKTLESIPTNQRVIIKTGKGNISIRLLKADAPFTVLSFYKLIRKRFFNGLDFHRVVPNFVIQGGDPRGDGWGGPNYAIRTEVSLVNYERGTMGVASAGKDTEGCQFFIAHSPQPHLDGRYTIFATVVSGLSVVDKIQIGDKILTVSLAQ